MTREEMWKEFENQLISETRTPITMSFDNAEKLTKLGIKETVAKWKKRLEQTRWIPVSQNSPLEGQFVLCSIAEYADTVHRIIIAKYEKNSLYWEEFVTAWMPLPQPYNGESEVHDADSD